MENFYLLKGIILGFSVAAPIGPVSVLVIKRSLSSGLKFGFLSGLGATTAVTIYSLLAALGLTLVTNLLMGQQFLLRLIGGFFLYYLGIKIYLSKPAEKVATAKGESLFRSYLSVLFLTITNPIAILTFTGMFEAWVSLKMERTIFQVVYRCTKPGFFVYFGINHIQIYR
ncbi:LysE family translocator [Terrihalobacillus insolitus]|uniref:LysE family translocator n=1 Tax=Terrihalobacillus insolitus TaxID=2950438 RepID=UPI003A9586A5